MKIYCYIIDDEKDSASLILEYIERTDGIELLDSEQDPLVAVHHILSGEINPDIVFLDIEMNGMDGITLAKKVKNQTGVIFTTGHRDYAPEAYELDVIDYLLKPIRYVRFLEAIEKAKRYLSLKNPGKESGEDFIWLRDALNSKMLKFNHRDIQYIEGNGNYSFVHSNLSKPVLTNQTMIGIAEKLTTQRMAKVNKRFIVNFAHVVSLYTNEITMTNGNKVPLSRRYRKQFLDTFDM